MDESDRTLVRVARADVDEDEDPKVTSHKERHKRRSTEGKKRIIMLLISSSLQPTG